MSVPARGAPFGRALVGSTGNVAGAAVGERRGEAAPPRNRYSADAQSARFTLDAESDRLGGVRPRCHEGDVERPERVRDAGIAPVEDPHFPVATVDVCAMQVI